MINHIISTIDWEQELESLDVNTQLAIFEDFVQDIIANFIPPCTTSNNSRPPWSNRDTRLLLNRKKHAYSLFRHDPTFTNESAYKTARNAAVAGFRTARAHYEQNIILKAKQEPKAIFAYINKNKKTTAVACLKNSDGTVLAEDFDICSCLNQSFSKVLQPTVLSYPPSSVANEVNFAVEDVKSALAATNDSTSCGPDGISPVFVKNCATALATPLFCIFSNSIKTCTFPTRWKYANITPIHKTGSPHDVNNYRPISLLPIFSKILERLMYRELYEVCANLNIIPTTQHGFLPGRSCLTNLLSTYNQITSLVDNGLPCDQVFLDFSKAFDSVSHSKLIAKLTAFNFPVPIISWIHSYLYRRYQRVSIRGCHSQWAHATSGVPQGSVLGPLLFNIFMADLPRTIVSTNNSYADDFKIFSPSFLSTTLQNDLNHIADWAASNSLQLNPGKCAVLHFGHNNPSIPYYINGKTVASKPSHTDLGVLVDTTLKFHLHADFTISKAMRKAHYILRSFQKTDPNLFSILYKTFLRPVLEYCSQIARPCYATFVDRLERCQRRLTKWCKQLHHLPYPERLLHLRLPTLKLRLLRGDAILVYQILNHLLDINPDDYFCFHPTSTRGHSLKLKGSISKLNIRHHFITERAVTNWNSLPEEVVNAPSLNTFKARLDRHLAG
jgi:hypothetical protein